MRTITRWSALAAAALAAATACGVTANEAEPPGGQTIRGSLVLTSSSDIVRVDGQNAICRGTRGYNDIRAGAQLTVTGDGTTVGLATLGDGQRTSPTTCTFPFTIRQVPRRAFYKFELGRRPGVSFSWDDLADQAWVVGLTVGP